MSVTLSKEQCKLIQDIAQDEGFEDYTLEVTPGSMKGDGYLGVINTVHLQDANKELNLILKSAMPEEKLREVTPIRKVYEREIYMYETVFPQLRKVSADAGISNPFRQTAKCYGSTLIDKEECLVLENLKEIGFKLWNRKIPMNEEHIAIVFSTYGKLHATGIAFKILNPESFDVVRKNLANVFEQDEKSDAVIKETENSFASAFDNGFKAVDGDEKATSKLKEFSQNWVKFILEDARRIDKYSTILHGDCWCNNMMFKYEDSISPLIPTDVCLLDWQVSHFGSPIFDLSYFFYASSAKEELYNLDKFLKIYYYSFSKTLNEAGVSVENILTYKELEEQWKLYSRYGLCMLLLLIKVILSDVEDAPNLTQLAEAGVNLLESISTTKSSNIEAVNKRIADVIFFMIDNDYL